MNAMGMDQLTKTAFRATLTPIPFKFKKPADSDQYNRAFSPAEKFGIPDPMCLFRPATLNGYHVAGARVVGRQFEDYIDGVIAAIGTAVDQWASLAVFVNVQINAVVALGQAGCLKGPKMEPLIRAASPPMRTQSEQKYSNAIAKGVGKCWDEWADNVQIPGLPLYPAFAVVPVPVAPPMPNLPIPLLLCPSTKLASMTPDKLSKAMSDALGGGSAQHHGLLFDSLGKGIGTVFLAWLGTTMVTNMIGTGPVPVPYGPVVNGIGNSLPKGIVSAPSGASALRRSGGADPNDDAKKKTRELEQAAKQSEQKAKQEMEKLKQESARRQAEAEQAAREAAD